MGFFDSLKANASVLKDKATDLAQTGAAESKRLAEIAKLKSANLSEENAIKKAYIEIGKLYYEQMAAAPGEDFAAACEKITAAKANIEANNDRIAELKNKDDDKDEGPVVVAEVEAVVVDAPAEEATAEDFADEAKPEE
jgi:hypothetical protein